VEILQNKELKKFVSNINLTLKILIFKKNWSNSVLHFNIIYLKLPECIREVVVTEV